VTGTIRKSFDDPDQRDEVPLGLVESVTLGSITMGRETLQAGWRWSTHVKPIVGTERCEFRHVGIQVSGRQGFEDRDGVRTAAGPGDAYDVAPGHDSWVEGHEPSVSIDFVGVVGWGLPAAPGQRVLKTILFTDIVNSTRAAERMGDRRWGNLMTQHGEDVRMTLAARRGREVKMTGDGFLAVFDGPADAVEAARAITGSAGRLGVEVRAGVHTGEVEQVGDDLIGVAVHLAARVMDAAGPGEVLVSATTRELLVGTDLALAARGEIELKGITGTRALYALESDTEGTNPAD
jgi:class 3 adenylate cyclase